MVVKWQSLRVWAVVIPEYSQDSMIHVDGWELK